MTTDLIPVVEPSDLERMYQHQLDHPGYAMGNAVIASLCLKSDLEALAKRLMFLKMLTMMPEEFRQRLSPSLNSDGSWPRAAFRVAARFPMDWLKGKTFSMEELDQFIDLLQKDSNA